MLFLGGCEDTKDWDDGRGAFAKNCEDQKDNCEYGHPKPGHSGYMGILRNYPENNCCVCGKFEQGREFQDILRRCYDYFDFLELT